MAKSLKFGEEVCRSHMVHKLINESLVVVGKELNRFKKHGTHRQIFSSNFLGLNQSHKWPAQFYSILNHLNLRHVKKSFCSNPNPGRGWNAMLRKHFHFLKNHSLTCNEKFEFNRNHASFPGVQLKVFVFPHFGYLFGFDLKYLFSTKES